MDVRDAAAMRAYLQLLGISARELAARAGLGHATVSHLLSGRRQRCSAATALAIENALGVRSGVFFEVQAPSAPRRTARRTPSGPAFGPRSLRR